MTNHWVDIKNADVVLIMGSNAAENHPIAFKWITAAKNNGATIISVDPRFTRSSSKADIYASMRSGTDIAFLGGMIKYALDNYKYNIQYLLDGTNASYFIDPNFQTCRDPVHPGQFSAKDTWTYHLNDLGNPIKLDGAIEGICPVHGDACGAKTAFMHLKEQYSVYDAATVCSITGTDSALYDSICQTYCDTYLNYKSATMLYAMGWTQHTVGSQNIRAASILQMLLGNMGVAGGGINALRGWHNVQGSTDHGVLFHLITGYNPSPQNIWKHSILGAVGTANSYLDTETPKALDPYTGVAPVSGNWWGNRPKYVISMLKAWWPNTDYNVSYQYLPKRHKDLSHISVFEDMLDTTPDSPRTYPLKGLFVWGTNPGVVGPNVERELSALHNLDWMVVCDLFETETSNFWKRPGVDPSTIKTEVFLLPGAAFYEKKGAVTNSGRLAQWKDKACDPPGEALDELEILRRLGDAIKTLYSGSALEKDKPVNELNWPYDTRLSLDLSEGVAKEINGYYVATGTQVTNFVGLQADGTTACGNWLFSGTWPAAGNQMLNRDPIDYHPAQIGIFHKWGYSWPLNRRIIYNRASVYQTGLNEGTPLAPSKWVIWWDPLVNAYKANGDVVDGYATAKPSAYYPFIMRNEGMGRLMGIKGLTDGPFPEHYEPKETPLTANILTAGLGPLSNPFNYIYPGTVFASAGDPNYPIIATTYRLSEHWHGGGMTRNLPWLIELMPEPFVEVSEELALSKGIISGDDVIVSSARGSITVKACITKRFKPFTIGGVIMHQVGMPWHWGFAALSSGPSANILTPHIGDANTRIPEYKAFMVNIIKA
jgi:formate dehydrogenase major subunit